jgi:5-methylcytosine-specific restriction protein A
VGLRAFNTCQHPGCPELVRGGNRCQKHGEQASNETIRQRREYDRQRNREEHRAIYKSARWIRLRKMKLRESPFCELEDLCVKRTGRPAPATVVDHIESVQEQPDLAYDWDNLRSACKPCHDSRTAREQGFARSTDNQAA